MTGKDICEVLKRIRKNIAELNGIEYEPHECDHDGPCRGTCPYCDFEAADLMKELRRKEAHGSPIRIDAESIENYEDLVAEIYGLDLDEEDDDMVLQGDIIQTPGIPAPPESLEGELMNFGDLGSDKSQS